MLSDLRTLGVRPGGVLRVHSSPRVVGPMRDVRVGNAQASLCQSCDLVGLALAQLAAATEGRSYCTA